MATREMPTELGEPVPPATVKADEPQPAPSAMARVDRVFGTLVEYMLKVLFYRIGADERQYVQYVDQHYFVRPPGSDEPFRKLGPSGPLKGEQLTEREARRLDALGRVNKSVAGDVVRRGEVDGQRVEFVSVSASGDKYIKRGDSFYRQLPLLEKLDREQPLTLSEVAAAAARGELELDAEKLSKGENQPYLLEEIVGGAPLVVLWLAGGAVFFTVYMGFFNVRGFRHAIDVVRGKFDDPSEPGEVTHFQALSSALSATVGLGNIAGVTIAMTMGGPGAFFWMMMCGLFGMSSKFVECTLGQKYRQVKPDGTVLGGPMQYLHHGLKDLGLGPLGLVLSIIFTVMCILASFGGGNMFQANQSGQQMLAMLQLQQYDTLEEMNREIKAAAERGDDARMEQLQVERAELQEDMKSFGNFFLPIYGIVLAVMVAMVIIGGIKRIGATASRIVPTMCAVYIAACLWIILNHLPQVPAMVGLIFSEAFSPEAFGGGFVGILVIGVQRAAFSNEAGVGSAAIAHSAARTDEPVREGAVALMEPFIDTVVVCSMTALVILITGAWNNEAWIIGEGRMGTPLTSKAFKQEISFFPYILSVAVVLFAYSTMISWSYYGERCWERLFGARSTILYKAIYVCAVFVGAVVNLGSVLDFSDMMILSMAFPNIFGLFLLAPSVRRDLRDYWDRYKSGKFDQEAAALEATRRK